MSALDNLPPDQRAVLQMVLQRGRTYDEIAGLLSIDRAAVRRRALDAFDALAPATVLPGPESALITDYLLGQLPQRVAEQVFSYLEASEADRSWAQAVAVELASLTSGALPEIPVGAPLGADDSSRGGLQEDSDAGTHVAQEAPPVVEDPRPQQPARVQERPAWAHERPSSRRGGAILLGSIGAAIIGVVLIVALSGGGARPRRDTVTGSGPGTGTQSAGNPATTGTGGSTGTSTGASTGTATDTSTGTSTTSAPPILAQLNLTSPTGARSTLGIVQVVRVRGVTGIVIYAQGLPPNTSRNSYAVWLYNSPTSYRFVGFVQYLVGKNGTIDTSGRLKPGAAAYHHLLLTLETQSKPKAPGEVVLSGPFREHP